MTEHAVLHSTFTLERTYPVPRERVFAAWADPAAKARWFARAHSGIHHDLDFRVGGAETVLRPGGDGEPELKFESTYRDIVPGERIVYASTVSVDGQLATVSQTTVLFESAAGATTLQLTEQGTFLDGLEPPSAREQGTGEWLDLLAADLRGVRAGA